MDPVSSLFRAPRVLAPGLVLIVLAPAALAAGFFPSDCLPPASSAYVGTSVLSGPGWAIRNSVHFNFGSCTPTPHGAGNSFFDVFTDVVDFDLSLNGGVTWNRHRAQGNLRFGGAIAFDDGVTRLIDTEMLQMDIVGGSLPPATRIRESPTLASTGRTTITQAGGGYQIDSFFDVFVELSLDGGQTWTPSSQSGRISVVQQSPVPVRAGTWGSLKQLYR